MYNFKNLSNENQFAKCKEAIKCLCEIDSKYDYSKYRTLLNEIYLCRQNIQYRLNGDIQTYSKLCALVYDIHQLTSHIIDLNCAIFNINRNNLHDVMQKCFYNPLLIDKFNILYNLVVPYYQHRENTMVVTHFNKVVRVDNILTADEYKRLYNLSNTQSTDFDFVIDIFDTETHESHFESIRIVDDIILVVVEIERDIHKFLLSVEGILKYYNAHSREVPLDLDRSDLKSYVASLKKELYKRYPSADSGVLDMCDIFINVSFKSPTQEKYNIFLGYVISELHKIEYDLQSMTYDITEKSYLSLCNDEIDTPIEDLFFSDNSTLNYNEEEIKLYIPDYIREAIEQFKNITPLIEQYMPVDLSVSDKGLYCQYKAYQYLRKVL